MVFHDTKFKRPSALLRSLQDYAPAHVAQIPAVIAVMESFLPIPPALPLSGATCSDEA